MTPAQKKEEKECCTSLKQKIKERIQIGLQEYSKVNKSPERKLKEYLLTLIDTL